MDGRGLLDEVRSLANAPRASAVPRARPWATESCFVTSKRARDLDECVRDAITQSNRLARRQRSWFSRDPRIEWFDDVPLAAKRLSKF